MVHGLGAAPLPVGQALQRGLGFYRVVVFWFLLKLCCRQEEAIQMQVLRAMQAGGCRCGGIPAGTPRRLRFRRRDGGGN